MTLTNRELRLMAQTQESFFPEVVDILRMVTSGDGFGGQTKHEPEVVLSDIPARVTQAQTQALGGEAARDIEVENWTVRLPIGTDIRENDYVQWGDIRIQADEIKDRSYETATSISGKRVK